MHSLSLPKDLHRQIPWAMHEFGPLVPARSALVVVDLQNAFMRPGYKLEMAQARAIVPHVNQLITAFRRCGGTVLFLRHTVDEHTAMRVPDWQFPRREHREWSVDELGVNAVGNELYAELDVADSDIILRKYRPSAFSPGSSEIQSVLRDRRIETLVVVGTATNVCCDSTARDANMLNYKVHIVADATAAASDQLHNASLISLSYFFARVSYTADLLAALAEITSPATSAAAV